MQDVENALTISFIVQFALGVLNLPSTLNVLGALPGALLIVAWGTFNTYVAILFGQFRARHTGIHSVADIAGVIGGPWLREIVGALFVIINTLCVSISLVGLSTALNALSHHAVCTVWFSFVATVAVILGGSVRKLHAIGWLTSIGFLTLFTSVFIVV